MKKGVTVKLQPVNQSNWEICANLKVSGEQKDRLPDNLFSIAELNFYPQTKAVAIVNESGTIVGFATFGIPMDEAIPKIFRLMIDEKYQGKGYGKSALVQIAKELFSHYKSNEIQVCYNSNVESLKTFYKAIGFKQKGIIPSKRGESGKILATLSREDFLEMR